MGHTLDSRGNYDPQVAPKLSDAVAINYADSAARLLRAKFTGARIADETGRTTQVILAGLAGATAAFDFGSSTVAALGLSSAAIPELQRIFNAKGRTQAYQDAVRLIEEAEIEYLSFNQNPSDIVLTQNGITLFQRTTATIHVVEKTLTGALPTVEDMQKATEPMSTTGAMKTRAGAPAVNNIPANQRAVSPDEAQAPREARLAAWRPEVRAPRTSPPAKVSAEIMVGEPTEEEIRVALKNSLAQQNNDPNADAYRQILINQGLDPAKIPGQSFATKVFEAYKNNPTKRLAISEAISKLPQPHKPEEIISGEPTEEQIRAALKNSLAQQNNDPNADAYRQILINQGLDPANIPGQTFATKIFEAYKNNPTKRLAISEAISKLPQPHKPEEIIPGEPTEEQIRAALKNSLAKQNNDPNADVYKQILINEGLDPAKIPGQTFATKVFEAYKNNLDNKRQAISKAIQSLAR
jgi:hypothetical protein